jgi:hypothetical protein
MAASSDECVAAFPRTQICLDRTYSRLLAWAAYIAAQPLPPTDTAPDKAFVQQRVVAERTPTTANMMTGQVAPYLLEVPNITQDIRSHLNAYNDESTESGLSSEIDTSLAVVMPKYAATIVSDQELANWCDKNGYPRPPDLVGVLGGNML